MRIKLDTLKKLGKFKIKLIERAGNRLIDILHKSNAWRKLYCNRDDCIICSTKDSKKGSCRPRNVLHETYCITCKKEKEAREKESKKDEGTLVLLLLSSATLLWVEEEEQREDA